MIRKLIVSAALLAVFNMSYAELDWNITGSGARAAGMGNAFIGIADDATAINWNPGGLTALEHFEASVVGGSVYDKEEYKFEDNGGWKSSESLSYNHANLNFLSVAYPFSINEKKLVVAAAFQKQLDFFSEDSWGNSDEEDEYKSEGGVYTLNLGAGYQVLPYLSFGATANFWTGASESDEEYINNAYSYTISYYSENSDFSGLNFVIGALFDMSVIKENVPLKIGAVVKTPFDLDYDYYQEFILDDIYNDVNDYNEEYSYSGTVEMPFMFGIGASYRFGENFTIGIDFERRNYAKSKFISEDDNGKIESDYMTASEKDVSQFRLGMEYLVITDAVVIPLRCGIFNYPTLWTSEKGDKYFTGEYDDGGYPIYTNAKYEQVVGFGVSLGSGVIFESFALDMCMNLFSYERKDEIYYADGDWEGYEYEESWTNTKATASLSAVVYLDTFFNK